MPLNIVFMGTPHFSVPVLDALIESGHSVAAVYSQPPRPAGRGMTDAKSPVHRRAEELSIPVLTPMNFKTESERAVFASIGADAAVVVAYGLLLPKPVLAAPRLGCFNVHASKLPRWRGAAPIQRAIMAGDTVTAVNIMRMEVGLDTGPVCLGQDVIISPDMTGGALHDALSAVGAKLMVEALAKLEAGALADMPQSSDGVTYAAKIDKREVRIDFAKSAFEVINHIRALSPAPGAWFEILLGEGSSAKVERIKVLAASLANGDGAPGVMLDDRLTIACGRGAIAIRELQRSGRKPVSLDEFLRGCQIVAGTRATIS